MHRAAQQHLAAGQRRALRDRTRFEIDEIWVAPGDMLALVHDVEADRQAFGRKLAVDVAVGAIEHHLTFVQGAPLDELEVQRLAQGAVDRFGVRSEEHTSELQSLMRISYAVFCLKKKKKTNNSKHA